MKIVAAGEQSVIVYPQSVIEQGQISGLLAAWRDKLSTLWPERQVSVIIGPESLLINFAHPVENMGQVRRRLKSELQKISAAQTTQGKIVEMPVCFSHEHGPDFNAVAAKWRMSAQQLESWFCQRTFNVAAIGFAPGFAYLGTLPVEKHLPRRSSPRTRVAAGSLAVADKWAAIYPQTSPGGWHLIGRTPMRIFAPDQMPPVPYTVGDTVRFTAISAEQFSVMNQHA